MRIQTVVGSTSCMTGKFLSLTLLEVVSGVGVFGVSSKFLIDPWSINGRDGDRTEKVISCGR